MLIPLFLQRLSLTICLTVPFSVSAQESSVPAAKGELRVRSGLQVLYDFSATDGVLVRDRAGVGKPMNLKIADLKAVRRKSGSLEVKGKALIRSEHPVQRVSEAIKKSGEITIEAWLKPAKSSQKGPARIVTLSRNTGARNFTLGQDKDRYDVRFRTQKTDGNGSPSTNSGSKSLEIKLTHVIYTRDRSGQAKLYVNGRKRGERVVKGDLKGWDATFHLALANEMSGDRPWLGTFYLVAIYNRGLSSAEVGRNFRAGRSGDARELLTHALSANERLFENKIAPLLAEHCLECHDSASHEGKLDLSKRKSALAGGKHGEAFVAGNLAKSRVWESVESDEMPEDRDPLSKAEKKLLRAWIEGGAKWSLEEIDPADYAYDDEGGAPWIQRLTIAEYIATVKASTGVDVSKQAYKLLPPDLRADGFSNTAYNLGVDLKHIDAYAKLAGLIVRQMKPSKFAARFSKKRGLDDDKNMGLLISAMGKHLLRGPLSKDEIFTYRGIMTTTSSLQGDFNEAVGYVIEAMLQSPKFVYRMEIQKGDGSAWPASEYELASRMSYILWGAPPDKELMRVAENGDIFDPTKAAAQVDRMLRDPRAVDRSVRFIEEWLNLGRLENLSPNQKRFPAWNALLAADMRNETIAFFKEIVWKQKRPLADLLNANQTILTPRLAEFYGIKPVSRSGGRPVKYSLAKVKGRGGLLTQASVLTIGGDDASMVTRGLFVMRDLLRGVVKDPPPNTNLTPVKSRPGMTQRKSALVRIKDANCGGCHLKFEPFAFGLEKFDGIGAYHEKDEFGNALRDDGEILIPGETKAIAYQNASQLMDLLAKSDRVKETLTWKLCQFAFGRPLTARDARAIDQIHQRGQKNGGTYQSVMKAIVLSDLVKATQTEKTD